MAIPSRQIGQPSSTKAQLLWNISKQLENLTKVAGNVYIPTSPVSNLWTFTPGEVSVFPTSTTGYTLYEGGWSNYDDGQTTDPFPIGGEFFNGNGSDTQFYLSTNGYTVGASSSYPFNGNNQDLFLTPGDPLDDGDTQNFWYQNTGDAIKWKTSILVYCGHCCGSPNQQTPYSYVLNIYRDSQYQYLETVCKTNISGTAGPGEDTLNSDTATQVWQSPLDGSQWTYLGFGSISGGCPECTTTTSTTTVNPGPTPSYTGTINVSTATPGNQFFNFRILSRDNGQYTSATVNWGDNTSDTYSIGPDSYVYFSHNYPSNDEWIATVTFDNPAQIYTIDLDRNNNESPAVVTGYDFRNLNGITQLIVNNNDALHIASTVGLSTLSIFQVINADLESLSLLDGSNITNLSANLNNLSVIDLTPATSLSYVNLADNQLVGIDISDSTNINYLDLSNNALAQVGVDAILLSLVQNNQSGGYLDLRGGANDAPSSTGASLVSTLQARGWTVYVNAESGTQTKLMYYMFGYSYNAKNSMFINDYYFNNNVNKYRQLYVQNRPPKTVYYVGTFGPNTTLFTNPQLTEFVVPQQNNWNYWMGVFVDATLPEVGSNVGIPGDIIIYSFSQYTGVILNELGTIATSTWTYQQVVNTGSPSTFCDENNAWNPTYAYYPPGQNGLVVGGYVFSNVDQYSGNGGDTYQVTPVVREGYSGTTVYSVAYGSGLITAANPCTYAPVWNASWGITAQDAIDGVNSIAIKPIYGGTSMLNTRNIKKADNTPFDGLPNLFYVAYDNLVRAFYNQYNEAYWPSNFAPLQIITPPATPYQITVLQTSCCSCFFDPNPYWQDQKFTAYSNFTGPGPGATLYVDELLTTPLQQYTYFTNGSFNFVSYDPWITYSNPC